MAKRKVLSKNPPFGKVILNDKKLINVINVYKHAQLGIQPLLYSILITVTKCASICPLISETCGGDINLYEGQTRSISSPGYDNHSPYVTGQQCSWFIKVTG